MTENALFHLRPERLAALRAIYLHRGCGDWYRRHGRGNFTQVADIDSYLNVHIYTEG